MTKILKFKTIAQFQEKLYHLKEDQPRTIPTNHGIDGLITFRRED